MNNNIFSRQSLIFNKEDYEITIKIYGVGFVGTNLAHNLARTGFKNLFFIDFDIVEEHNLLNQSFKPQDIGKYKTNALKEAITKEMKGVSDININTFNLSLIDMAQATNLANDQEIIILAVDTLEARAEFAKNILKNWNSNNNYKNTLFLFVNTSGNVIYIGQNHGSKSFFKKMVNIYTKTPKKEFTAGLCGEKSIFYLGSLISSYIIAEIRDFITSRDEICTSCKKLSKHNKEILYDIKKNRFNYDFKWFS